MKSFPYAVRVEWMGNDGRGTSVAGYARDHEVSATGKPTYAGSAPKEFGGNGFDWSPEELLVAAVSQCHMLTYLFQCSRNGIVVESYADEADGVLEVAGAEGGQFAKVTLRPVVTISAGDPQKALALHEAASQSCYVGRSVAFPVEVLGEVRVVQHATAA